MNAKRARRLATSKRRQQAGTVYDTAKVLLRKAAAEGKLKTDIRTKDIIGDYHTNRTVVLEYVADFLKDEGYTVELLDDNNGGYWKMNVKW